MHCNSAEALVLWCDCRILETALVWLMWDHRRTTSVACVRQDISTSLLAWDVKVAYLLLATAVHILQRNVELLYALAIN